MKRKATYFCIILAILLCVPAGSVFVAKSVSEHALSAGRSVGSVAKKYVQGLLPSDKEPPEKNTDSSSAMAELSFEDELCVSSDKGYHLCLAGIFTENEGTPRLCSLMMISLDKKDGRMRALDLPCDIGISCESGGAQSPAEFFALGGSGDGRSNIKGLCDFVSSCLGLSFDGYFFIHENALPAVVDSLDGVRVKLSKELYSPLADEGLLFGKGEHIFDKNDCARALESPDAQNASLYSKILFAIGDKLKKQSDLPSLLKVRGALISHTVSNLTLSKTMRMAPAFMKGVSHKTEVTVIRGENAKEKLEQWLW